MVFIDIFRTFHPNAEECPFFSSAHGMFSRIDHILGNKINLSRFKKIKILSSLFSDHNAVRLDINYKRKKKKKNSWRLNNTFPNNQQVTKKKSKGKFKNSRNKWQWKHDNLKPMWCSKSSSKREDSSNRTLPQETRKTPKRQPNFTSKTTGKRRTKKSPKLVEGKKS